ncbi:DUF5605 domain-containing protein [Desertihabitans aurantiacus]|uniref:DUF5605 domain-containing protein n=1 Tax=Desertihabitans aurantiacus TaxID=2282477 RepID=UPI000DF784C3|nr:DUF5605 domain-containing protein [Desertihabitans aurantiacus]
MSTVVQDGRTEVGCWQVVTLDLTGTAAVEATFTGPDGREAVAETVEVDGRRLVRFAPDAEGDWSWEATDGAGSPTGSGGLRCTSPGAGEHGPLRVRGTRFVHADGTPHHPMGTTALFWHHRDGQERAATLRSLAGSPFNAVRMSVLAEDARDWPDETGLDAVETAVRELAGLGVRAELVLSGPHPAVRPGAPGWEQHLRRAVARFAASSHVSWCLALDADRLGLPGEVWDESLRLLAEADAGRRLRTVHAAPGFDFGHRLITHSTVRDDGRWEAHDLVRAFAKPALLDVGAEGDAPVPGGGLTAEELVSQTWWALCRGGYGWHTEEFVERSWSRHGGTLTGAALPRLAFLRGVLEGAPDGLARNPVERHTFTLERPGHYYLQYHGLHRYSRHRVELPEDADFTVEVIDTQQLTIDRLPGTYRGGSWLELPRRPFLALRMVRC